MKGLTTSPKITNWINMKLIGRRWTDSLVCQHFFKYDVRLGFEKSGQILGINIDEEKGENHE